jgi:hypothetical protein
MNLFGHVGVRNDAEAADGAMVALPLKNGLTQMQVETGMVRFAFQARPVLARWRPRRTTDCLPP